MNTFEPTGKYDRHQIRRQKWHVFPLVKPDQAGAVSYMTGPKHGSSRCHRAVTAFPITPRCFCLITCSPPRDPDGLRLGIANFFLPKTCDHRTDWGSRARRREQYYAQHSSDFSFRNLAACIFAFGQTQPRVQQPPPLPRWALTRLSGSSPPQAISDATFEAFRKQMNEAAQPKNRGALAKLVIGQGFFWLRENGDRADKKKSGVDNLRSGSRSEQQGWCRLGHARKFCRRSDRLAFARTQGRALCAGRSYVRRRSVH